MADATPPCAASLPRTVNWRVFLTDYPPGTRASVDEAVGIGPNSIARLALPELRLYCDENCRTESYGVGVLRTAGLLFPGPKTQSSDMILCYDCQKRTTEIICYSSPW